MMMWKWDEIRGICGCIRMIGWAIAMLVILLAQRLPCRAAQPVVRLFTTEDGLVRNWVTKIRRDSLGRLWFCTVEGLSLFDGQRFANYTTADGLPHRMVNDILEAGNGSYWLSTGAGLYRFRPRTAKPASFERAPRQAHTAQVVGLSGRLHQR
jgi:ligand-binding sensor domain-containing protein